ncbi:MAG: alkane 1-monooxygenase [Alphaproteobacteria bacterium]
MSLPAMLTWIIAIPVDEAVGDNWSRRIEQRYPTFLNALLYLQLPALSLATFFFAYYLSDWTFLGPALDVARERTVGWDLFMTVGGMALFYAIAGINVAHELIHRNNRTAVTVGRWLLSFSLDTGFSLEHVYGHHVNVGTLKDPVTAPRGMNFWRFYVRAIVHGNRNAWRIEKRFLEKRGRSVWSVHNRFITGQLMSLVWIVLLALAAGWVGVAAFLFMALWSKLYLELTNYIEHYGLVRVEGTRVEARHSWNSSRRLTNWLLFNLPRHADHHIKPGKNYWELDALRDAPQLPHGYFAMAVMAMVPPIFMRKIRGPLENWDRDHASDAERAIIAGRGVAAADIVDTPAVPAKSMMSGNRARSRAGQ